MDLKGNTRAGVASLLGCWLGYLHLKSEYLASSCRAAPVPCPGRAWVAWMAHATYMGGQATSMGGQAWPLPASALSPSCHCQQLRNVPVDRSSLFHFSPSLIMDIYIVFKKDNALIFSPESFELKWIHQYVFSKKKDTIFCNHGAKVKNGKFNWYKILS